MPILRRALASVVVPVAAATVVSLVSAPPGVSAPGPTAAGQPAAATTAARAEAAQVDAPVPDLRWRPCPLGLDDQETECATATVPLDYDRPNGPTTTLGLVRVLAANPDRRIGSLFVNPGGPGGPSTEFAPAAAALLGSRVSNRFDVVGVDPRGVGSSANAFCRLARPLPRAYIDGYPLSRAQARARIATDDRVRGVCDRTAPPIVDHASTADTARDMDLIRQAVGDEQLTYYGVSYGSHLGAVYAAMFPDRVRALIVDAVLDPVAWTTGRGDQGRTRPFTARLRSGRGAYEGLLAAFDECDRVGLDRCRLSGGATEKWRLVLRKAKQGELMQGGQEVTRQDIVGTALGSLYDGPSIRVLTSFVARLHRQATSDPGRLVLAGPAAAEWRELQRVARVRDRVGPYEWAPSSAVAPRIAAAYPALDEDPSSARAQRFDLSFQTVTCSDSVNPRTPSAWTSTARRQQRVAPWFGPLWTWQSSLCARQGVGSGEDAFRGPWRTRTSTPLLVVGNSYDPATPISGARRLNGLFAGSRLLQVDIFGHGAIGVNRCATAAMADYLVGQRLTVPGKVCAAQRELFPAPRG